jgi:hypothetical protein
LTRIGRLLVVDSFSPPAFGSPSAKRSPNYQAAHELLTPRVAKTEVSLTFFAEKAYISLQISPYVLPKAMVHENDELEGLTWKKVTLRPFATMASTTDTKNYKFNHSM